MTLRAILVALTLCVTPHATAQDQQSQTATYFLIDASGSMEERQSELDAALESKRKELAQSGSRPAIETRFGGSNGGQCGTPVEIGVVDTGPFQNDNTQLGAALQAALEHAGDGPADIFIFTDEEQTSGCGPDICTVADRTLPKAGVTVQTVPIDASAFDHKKARCIAEAQDVSVSASPLFTISINVDRLGDTSEKGGTQFSWTHSLLWAALILLLLGLLGQAGLLTYLYSVRGVIRERQTRQRMSEAVQSAAPKSLELEDETDEDKQRREKLKLDAEAKRIKDERHNRITLTPKATWFAKWMTVPNAVLLVLIGLLLWFDDRREEFIISLLDFVTSNIGAGLVCSVLVATFGWLIVQFWQITDAKNKTRDYQLDLEKAEQIRSADAIARYRSSILGWRVERPFASASKWFAAVRSKRDEKVDQIKRLALEIASTVEDEAFLEQTVREMRNERYAEIVRQLITKNRVNPQSAPTAIALLEATSSQLLTTHRQRLEDFDLSTLQR